MRKLLVYLWWEVSEENGIGGDCVETDDGAAGIDSDVDYSNIPPLILTGLIAEIPV